MGHALQWAIVAIFCLPVGLGGFTAIGLSFRDDRQRKRDGAAAMRARLESGREED